MNAITRMSFQLIPEAVSEQAGRSPNRVAAQFGPEQLTYGELWEQVLRLAGRLRLAGVREDAVVAVAIERSLELPIALLGVLASGGAYLPLDVSHPEARLRFMLADSGAQVVITREQRHRAREPLHDVLSGYTGTVVSLDEDLPSPGRLSGAHQDGLAYVIYTSGSTGVPKAVMNTHRAIANRLAWMQAAYGLTAGDGVLQKTPIGFDVSVWELFWPLMTGARLVMARPGGHRDPSYLIEAIRQAEITTLHFVPSMLRAFLAAPGVEDCGSIRQVMCSGEELTADLADRAFERLPGARLHNLYGPTEAAVDVTAWECRPRDRAIPIGAPISNVRAYVVDETLTHAAPGQAGELLIGGVALARGYLGRPAMTAERFVPDHISGEAGARLYRTGDRARRREDGTLEFLGRLDDQVKIRGVRVEPGEATAVLARHGAVADVEVMARPDETRQQRLIGYVVPDPVSARPVAELLRIEQAGLPCSAFRYDLPDGRTVLVPSRSEAEFLVSEIFDQKRYAALGIELSPGGQVVDVGAHIGLFTLYAAGLGATVCAFEPVPPLYELLRRNITLHGVSARLFPYALGSTEGEVAVTYYPNLSIMSGRYADEEQDRAVVRAYLGDKPDVDRLLDRSLVRRTYIRPVRRLSAMLRTAGAGPVDLLKIDAEKSEEEVIGGVDPADWLKIRQVLIEVHDIGGRLARLTARLENLGYNVRTDRDPRLAGTGLVMLAATRPSAAAASQGDAIQTTRTWGSPARLVADLRRYARQSLPDVLVPAAFVLLPEFPLTPNGKLDRHALPSPPSRPELTTKWAAPEGAVQEELSEIWSELLGQDTPGADDDFFELGGHSLLANQLVTRCRITFGVELPLDAVFAARTIRRIADELAAAPPAAEAVPDIRPARHNGHLPLSFSQERLWFLQQLHPGIRAYQFQAAIELTGPLDRAALIRALSDIVRRHEVYRTTFTDEEPEDPDSSGDLFGLAQIVHPPAPVDVPLDDLGDAPNPDLAARELIREAVSAEIPVDRLPLVRWRLLRLAADRHILLHAEHHLVHDGWAFNIFLGELCALYGAHVTGGPSPLPEPQLQFADLVTWQRRWLKGPVSARQIRYWLGVLDGVPEFLNLATDRPRRAIRRFLGDAPRYEIPAELADRVRVLARRERVTLFTVMLATFEVLLCHWSGQDDFCVGSGIANRRWPQTEQVLGMIINTVALRADLREDPTFRELLSRVQAITRGAHSNQDVPFDQVVAALRPQRVPGRHPLCQVVFAFHDAPMPTLRMPEVKIKVTPGIANGTAKFDLNVIVIPHAEQNASETRNSAHGVMEAIWEYDQDLFDAQTITRAAGLYQQLLEAVTANPLARVSDLKFAGQDVTANGAGPAHAADMQKGSD